MTRRLLIDAMNLIGSKPDGWWNDPRGAMKALAVSLDEFAGEAGEEITVVYDKDPGPLPSLGNIRISVAKRKGRNAADHEICELVAADPNPSTLIVVTSDRQLVEKVQGMGARTMGAGTFRDRVERN